MENKAVIILCNNLPKGLQANISAVLGMSLGRYHPDLIGHNVKTIDNKDILGITTIPVPILTTDEEGIQKIFLEASNFMLCIPFGKAALTTKNYNEYEEKVKSDSYENQEVKGLLLYDSKKNINKITGQLSLLR